MNQTKPLLSALLFLSLFFSGCFAERDLPTTESGTIAVDANISALIATIGQTKIKMSDVSRRMEAARCYGDNKTEQATALIQLANDALEAESVSAFGENISADLLKERAAWIDQNTKAPEILNCVKKVYAEDPEGYRIFYVRPTIANRMLRTDFAKDQTIHARARARILEIQTALKADKKLTDFPEYKKFEIPKSPNVPDTLKNAGTDMAANPLVEQVLAKLKIGQTWQDVVEDDYSFQLVKLLKTDEKQYYCEGVIVPKENFEKWWREYVKKKIELKIFDGTLKNELQKNYGAVWWVEEIR